MSMNGVLSQTFHCCAISFVIHNSNSATQRMCLPQRAPMTPHYCNSSDSSSSCMRPRSARQILEIEYVSEVREVLIDLQKSY